MARAMVSRETLLREYILAKVIATVTELGTFGYGYAGFDGQWPCPEGFSGMKESDRSLKETQLSYRDRRSEAYQ